jgi:hypothetical protein
MSRRDGRATEVPLPPRDAPVTLDGMSRRRAAKTKGWRTCGPAAALILVLTLAPSAQAGIPSTGVFRQGPCTGLSHWRLRVLPDATGMLDVRFLLAGGAPGDTWDLYLDRNGTGVFAGSRVADDLGSVRVRKLITDSVGTLDVISAGALDIVTGEVCQGRVRL